MLSLCVIFCVFLIGALSGSLDMQVILKCYWIGLISSSIRQAIVILL